MREGGTLVYSTCSLPVEENEDQVAWVLDNFPALVLEEQVTTFNHPDISFYFSHSRVCVWSETFFKL